MDDLQTTGMTTMGENCSNGMGSYVDTSEENKRKIITLLMKCINIVVLSIIMIVMGSNIDINEFKETFRKPAGFFVGMGCQFVLMPLIAFCLGLAFQLDDATAISLLILACCPGGSTSNVYTYWTDGDVCLSVCMTTLSTAAAIGMMPFNLFIYSRVWTDKKAVIPFVTIVTSLTTMLIPVAFGVFLRWWKRAWVKWFSTFGNVLIFVLSVLGLILTYVVNPSFLYVSWQKWLCAALLPIIGFVLGYALARILRQSHRKCRTIAFETGLQSAVIGLTLTVLTFAESPLFFEMLFVPTINLFLVCFYFPVVILVYKLVVRYQKKYAPLEVRGEETEEVGDDDVKKGTASSDNNLRLAES